MVKTTATLLFLALFGVGGERSLSVEVSFFHSAVLSDGSLLLIAEPDRESGGGERSHAPAVKVSILDERTHQLQLVGKDRWSVSCSGNLAIGEPAEVVENDVAIERCGRLAQGLSAVSWADEPESLIAAKLCYGAGPNPNLRWVYLPAGGHAILSDDARERQAQD